jgi:hypothetical protein
MANDRLPVRLLDGVEGTLDGSRGGCADESRAPGVAPESAKRRESRECAGRFVVVASRDNVDGAHRRAAFPHHRVVVERGDADARFASL